MKPLLHIACTPRPDRIDKKAAFTKADAAIRVITSFVEDNPHGSIIMTCTGHEGEIWKFMASMTDKSQVKST